MATGFPKLDPFNPLVQAIRDRFEREHLPAGGYEALESQVRKAFITSASRVYARALMADAFTPRWGLGETQELVSEELGIERSRISDIYRKGDLTLEGFLSLRFHPLHPVDWEPNGNALNMCDRAGLVGVANLLGRSVTARNFTPHVLDEFHYEIVCELLRAAREWNCARLERAPSLALDVIAMVADPQRDCIPFWYLKHERTRIEDLLRRLSGNADDCFTYLCAVQDSWEDVIIAAFFAAEPYVWNR
ncbi:hypothetical protein B7486_02020 [cyanobacterium TDX16]|nr:hypothetical protein B7486_02020 [cyanobacterium TDX16]